MRVRQPVAGTGGIMPVTPTDTVPIEEPLAELERHLIRAYIAGAGQDLHSLQTRTDEAARSLLAEASRYASAKLSEIEARFHYLHTLHGDSSPGA
jgi:hypothetical protein